MAARNAKFKKATVGTQASDSEPASSAAGVESRDPADPVVDHEDIARLAYSYWEARGFCGGSPEEDWLRAQEELRKGATTAARTAAA
jgi:hypothetical protein